MRYCDWPCCLKKASLRRKLDEPTAIRTTEAYCEKHKAQVPETKYNWESLFKVKAPEGKK